MGIRTRSGSTSPTRPTHVDTGFIVFNDRNYPSFQRLLNDLGVATQPSTMSFSVSDGRGDFEYNSRSLNGLFAKRAHLATPWFHGMLGDLARFHRSARELLGGDEPGPSLGQWLERERFLRAFVERLIVPQAAAVWSADPVQMGTFPARFLAEFFDHHGMLGFRDRPAWRTVRGGSARYVEALTARLRGQLRLATHADQALALLGSDANRAERTLLSAIPTSQTRRSYTPTSRCSLAAGGRGRAGTTTCSMARESARRSPTT